MMIIKEILFFFVVIGFLIIAGIIGEINLLASLLYCFIYIMYKLLFKIFKIHCDNSLLRKTRFYGINLKLTRGINLNVLND